MQTYIILQENFKFYKSKVKKNYGDKVDSTLRKINNELIWYKNSKNGG